MKNEYSRNITLRCVVCGSDSNFLFNDNKSYVKCLMCNREYLGGYDELVVLNKQLIHEELEATKDEIIEDLKADLKKAFLGNKFIKIKRDLSCTLSAVAAKERFEI